MSTLFRALTALCALTIVTVMPLGAYAQEDQPLNPKQQEAVKKLIHDYLIENPGIIAEAIDALREKEQLAAEAEAKKALTDRKDDIFKDPADPVLGNPKGDVTLVEFFDYRCPYCKTVSDGLFDTVKNDGKTRLVMKELPVLGPDSVYAARAALASQVQHRYEPFHRALMRIKGPLSEDAVMKAAAESGLNVEKLKKDMEDEGINRQLAKNAQLANALGVRGTPAFVVGDQLIPGAVSPQVIKQLIDQTRHPSPNKN